MQKAPSTAKFYTVQLPDGSSEYRQGVPPHKVAARLARPLQQRSSSAPINVESRAQQMLLELDVPLRVIADALGVSRTSVSHYRRGIARPQQDRAAVLESVFGIPVPAWFKLPL